MFALIKELNEKWQKILNEQPWNWMMGSSHELINVMLFQEQLIKSRLIGYLPGQPITSWNIKHREHL